MASKTTPTPLPFPTTLIVVKGCPALNVAIREHWTVKEVRELGPDYGHSVSIVIERAGKTLTFDVRHVNRLSDQEFNARRWEKPVRFARGPQDASVRWVQVSVDSQHVDACKRWQREIVKVAHDLPSPTLHRG